MLAVACVLGLVETSLPPIPVVPWLRIGLANIVVLVALLTLGWKSAALVSLGRVVLVGLLTGTLATPISVLAVSGALSSLVVMIAVQHISRDLSAVGLSAAGAASHVAAQFAAAAAMSGTPVLLALAPPSVLLALPLGAITGFAARLVVSRLERM
jgi:heptaprenyl diphosphate synthase